MKKIILLLTLTVSVLFAVDAKMEIIKKSNNLPTILVSSALENQELLVNKLEKIIINDLKVSGHFKLSTLKYKSSFSETPNNVTLANNGVDLFLNLYVEPSAFNGLSLKFKLFDVNQKRVVINRVISTSKVDRYPFIGHRVSILVNKHLNAPSIDWMDKFVIFSVYKNAKQADIYIGDYTLEYQKTVVRGGLNIFPKWANAKQEEFYYTTYNNGTPQLKKMNIYNRKRQTILKSQGMVVASDISKDGSKVLITASPNGQPDIYLYDVRTKIKKRLTKYKGIDVGAHFVENDTKIVFVSDRLKYPNIFAKKIGQRGVERLVYHGRNNSSATTFKNYVVYTSRDKENEFSSSAFNLYLISTQSDFIRRLTTNGSNQFPKFSEDGESILFIKRYKDRSSVGIIRVNYNKSFQFPLKNGKLQSIDW
jgi:TolB protein